MHEVAAGSLDANLDEVGYRSHCHRWGYRFFNGQLETVDREARQVILAPLLDEDGSEERDGADVERIGAGVVEHDRVDRIRAADLPITEVDPADHRGRARAHRWQADPGCQGPHRGWCIDGQRPNR